MLLECTALEASHGPAQALFGVDLAVDEGEAVALMGRNGMGKTTTVRAIMGLTPAHDGTVRLRGRDVTRLRPFEIARLGIGYVPEGRQVFPTLSVHEHLIATRHRRPGQRWDADAVYRLFPRLAERRAHKGMRLSGGEQQMLAIGRALTTNPRLLILDEATEGLAPLVREEIWAALAALKAEGQAILVIDKAVDALASLAERAVILAGGRSVWGGPMTALRDDPALVARWLQLGEVA